MWSVSVINHLNRRAAIAAAWNELEPYIPADAEEPLNWTTNVNLPNFGDYRPKGWCLLDSAFVDGTGVGHSWEPALTWAEFKAWAAEQASQAGDHQVGFAIIEHGQFQVYVGVFSDDPEKWLECEDDHEEYEIDLCPECESPIEVENGDFPEYCPECSAKLIPNPEPPAVEGETVYIAGGNGEKVKAVVLENDSNDQTSLLQFEDDEDWYKWKYILTGYDPANDPAQLNLGL